MNHSLHRREFLKKGSGVTALGIAPLMACMNNKTPENQQAAGPAAPVITAQEYLKEIMYTKQEITDWFAGKAFPFAKYHSEFGWLLPDAYFRDGLDDSVSAYHYSGNDGERIMIHYNDLPCRINTYGDSYTQCHQVSDGETWQEVLAAHLQEPVRNFGIGGWSVYQAYRRMLREEERTPAEYIIFNIYVDDHRRNLDSWRAIRRPKHVQFIEPTLPYLKVNLQDGSVRECENPCPTEESFFNLADEAWVYDTFKDAFALKIILAHKNAQSKNPYQSYADIMRLATTHGINTTIEDNATLSETAELLHVKAALLSSQYLVDKIEHFAREKNKKVLYVLSYPAPSIAMYVQEGTRYDQPFADFLTSRGLPFVDLMDCHVRDFAQFKGTIREYLKKNYVGHYNPLGNHFCAFALKNKLVELLDPKPLPYRADAAVMG